MPDKVTERDANLEFEADIPQGEKTQRVYVVACYSPGTPDVMFQRNGDPGDQGDPPEAEIIRVHENRDALEVDLLPTLSADAVAFLIACAIEEGSAQVGTGFDDCHESDYDDMRDMDDPVEGYRR